MMIMIFNIKFASWHSDGDAIAIYIQIEFFPKGTIRYRSNQIKLFQKRRKIVPKLRQKGNYLISDKREMCLFSPPDCVGQGDHGNSFLSISNEVSSEYLSDSQYWMKAVMAWQKDKKKKRKKTTRQGWSL